MVNPSPPDWTGRGLGLYPPLYAAMLLNGLLLIFAIYGPRPEAATWLKSTAGAFAVIALLQAVARVAFHDTYVSLSVGVRSVYFVTMAGLFLVPGMVRGHDILPEGFATVLPLLAVSAINGPTIRRWIGFSALGFWCAAVTPTPPSLILILAYGLSLLWLLAATHFAETGEPFELRGTWPTRTAILLSGLYFIPAAVVAAATYFLWPDLRPPAPAPSPVAPPVTARAAMSLNPEQMRELMIRVLIWLGIVAFAIVAMVIIRRRLGRRRRPMGMPKVFGTDLSDLQFFRSAETKLSRGMGGERGQIVRLWTKWANDRGDGRAESETAREVAARVTSAEAGDSSGATPPPSTGPKPRRALTELLEQAHYGPDPPTPADVAAMKRAIRHDSKG